MKIALSLLLLCIPAFAADTNKEISAVVESWKTAMLKGDAASLEKLYHKDLAYTHSSGKTETKAEAITNATKAGSVAKAIQIDSETSHVYGNTAVVKLQGNFTSATGTVNHLDMLMVWLKSSQGWELVGRQATKLP